MTSSPLADSPATAKAALNPFEPEEDVEEVEAKAIAQKAVVEKAHQMERKSQSRCQTVSPQEFLAACVNGDDGTVEAFLAGGGDATADEVLFDIYGESALHHAVRGGNLKVLKLLLGAGRMEANVPNARNETALLIACRHKSGEMVSVLIEASADPQRRDVYGMTPFLSAVFGGAAAELLQCLLQAQADVSAQDGRGVGALHFGAMRNDMVLMSWLLQHGVNPDLQTEHGSTGLMLAAKMGNPEPVSLLLTYKAGCNTADEAGCTALMHALGAGHSKIAQRLLLNGTSVDLVDSAGRSALFHAVLGGKPEGVAAVLERGGRCNVLDEEGRSPLYQACLMCADDIVMQLLDAVADPNLSSRGSVVRPALAQAEGGEEDEDAGWSAAKVCLDEARTCVQVCATLAHTELLATLLNHCADVNSATGALGWSSLHLCAVVGNEEGTALLLERGADFGLQDSAGNTAESLAERSGHSGVLEKLREASATRPPAALSSTPTGAAGAPKADMEEEQGEEVELLELYRSEWLQREQDGSLLDRALGPMVHDALRSEQWKDRWEAMMYISSNFATVAGAPEDLVHSVSEVLAVSAGDKVPKVFLAALTVLEVLLSDSRLDDLSPEEFAVLLCGQDGLDVEAAGKAPTAERPNAIVILLNQMDSTGTVGSMANPQQAAADALCSCILHGRVPLDEVAWPLFQRLDERLLADAQPAQDRKAAALAAKCLAANFKLLGRLLSAFGLQRSGLFRRALLVPLLLRGVASESSKVRGAASESLLQLLALSCGLEERLWAFLPPKARKGVERSAAGQEGLALVSAVPCEEDALAKAEITNEDTRAGLLICTSELSTQVWATLAAGEKAVLQPASVKHATSSSVLSAGAAVVDDGAAEALGQAIASKNWKDRVQSLERLAVELGCTNDGVKVLEDTGADDADVSGSPLLSQYVLRGLRISLLQMHLSTALNDTVTAVFVAAADLLRLIMAQVPLYVAPLMLEPLLPSFMARLLDTSNKVKAKVVETTIEVAALHGCALSEMIAQSIASSSAWTCVPPTPGIGAGDRSSTGRESDRTIGPRLQLLIQLVQQLQDRNAAAKWADETWKALADYAVKAAEHKSLDVRKEATSLLSNLTTVGGRAAEVAEHALAHLQVLAQQRQVKRPGTSSTRPPTGSTRLGTAKSRPGTGAGANNMLNSSGKLSNLGSTGGFTLTMGSTGRLSTASRSRMSGTGSSFRPRTGQRPGTGCGYGRPDDCESDNSIHSDPEDDIAGAVPDGEEVKFFNVKNSTAGADEVPDLVQGEAALREALPLAEALDEVAMDFVAPLIALFGDGWTRCFYSRNWQCRVAALTHLAATISQRLEELNTQEIAPTALSELLDGSMRAVHEGLGDHNVRVYAEACMAVTAVVPAFCGAVDGRLLVAHLAPLLRQLCARMGDLKESVRIETTQAVFRLLNPPTGNIVSPVAVAMLLLRHLAPSRQEEADSPLAGSKGATGKGAATGWLCRLFALRDLAKEHSKKMVQHPGAMHPGEWLRLKDGLAHGDPTVRHESARLFALMCKLHLKSLEDQDLQTAGREAWVAALPKDLPPKSLAQVRKLLKLSESGEGEGDENLGGTGKSMRLSAAAINLAAWEVPQNLIVWAGCSDEDLAPLKQPGRGDEKVVTSALKTLCKAVMDHDKSRGGMSTDEAFANICRSVQQALSSGVGNDRSVFLAAVELCQLAVQHLAPRLSGLDINLGLAKTFPILLERTAVAGSAGDVKIGVASDKLVQQLAKHPKVGCEAVTKMVISSFGKSERPLRPLVLLRTLLSDFGLRLCAQRDVVQLLLRALGTQLERVSTEKGPSSSMEGGDALRPQIIAVLATCNQFSSETVRYCMSEVEPSHRKLLVDALKEAPDPRLVALGATAAEQESVEGAHVAGSAVRAASRGRGLSPKPPIDPNGRPPLDPSRESPLAPVRDRRAPLAAVSTRSSRPGLPPRAEDAALLKSSSQHSLADRSPTDREASSGRRRPRHSASDHALPTANLQGFGTDEVERALDSRNPRVSRPAPLPRQPNSHEGLSDLNPYKASLRP